MTKILMIAGEASGDLLATQLYQSLKAKDNSITCFGMGGYQMRNAGIDILVDSDDLAVVGGLEIIKHFSKIRNAFKTIKAAIRQQKPDLVILVDYPGFNLRIAKFAKEKGCKVFFYVSPQIWAWRYHRIHHIKKYVDHMSVLFSFEEAIYQKENIPVSFVGHPLVDVAKPSIDQKTAYTQFKLNAEKPTIALFPGSRQQEVSRMMPLIHATIPLIKAAIPDAQFILPLANSLKENDIAPWLSPDITLVQDATYNALSISDAAIAVSGTVTLEIALQKVPLVVFYKMSPISFFLAKRLIKVPYISLCNLVAEDLVAKEFIQNDANPQSITNEIVKLIKSKTHRQDILLKMDNVKTNLGQAGASDRTADAVLSLL